MSVSGSLLPKPAEYLKFESVVLHFSKVIPGEAARGLVPYYHYRITVNGADVGHINLRVGYTEHVRLSAGHIGFEIAAPYRGYR
jgi:predicted acetyltransferase